MPISLEVISYRGKRPEKPISLDSDAQDITLGRGENNSLVLPDSDKFVSGHHATIIYQDPDYYVTDYSSNGLYINRSKQAVGKHNSYKLTHGDEMGMGEYLIKVSITGQNEHNLVENNEPTFVDPFADLGPDPIEKRIEEGAGNPTTWEIPQAGKTYVENNSFAAASAHSLESDPLSPLDEAFESVTGHVDKIDLAPEEKPDEFLDIGNPEDWMADESLPERIQPPVKNIEKQISSKAGIIQQPEMEQQPPSHTPPEPHQDSNAIKQFLTGAGLDDDNLSTQINDESFYLIGKILRMVVAGTMDILIGRNQIKNEMRLNVTTLKSVENNPIKLSFNVDEALVRLLGKQKQGYMPPKQAIEEAFDDLRIHQIAVLAGMQTALKSVLKLFDPERLEKRLQKRNPISASIPIQKRAKLWDLFEEMHEDIETEARDNFNELFGHAFAETYEEQSRLLKNQKKK